MRETNQWINMANRTPHRNSSLSMFSTMRNSSSFSPGQLPKQFRLMSVIGQTIKREKNIKKLKKRKLKDYKPKSGKEQFRNLMSINEARAQFSAWNIVGWVSESSVSGINIFMKKTEKIVLSFDKYLLGWWKTVCNVQKTSIMFPYVLIQSNGFQDF